MQTAGALLSDLCRELFLQELQIIVQLAGLPWSFDSGHPRNTDTDAATKLSAAVRTMLSWAERVLLNSRGRLVP